jgi:DNA repair and recombination protein RAD52
MFTEQQKAALAAPLNGQHVKRRQQAGRSLAYIEGWKVIDEANRIFGFDGWTRETVDLRCVCEKERKIGQDRRDGWGVSYVAKVRIVVFAADTCVTREGVGSGHGIDSDVGTAHESAVKEAETDATKRAPMTFGNAFGLALYDKELANVAGGNGLDAKAKFIAECTRAIGQFNNAEALLRWWNSDPSKQSRRDLHLTRHEIEDLKALVLQRKAQLNGSAITAHDVEIANLPGRRQPLDSNNQSRLSK